MLNAFVEKIRSYAPLLPNDVELFEKASRHVRSIPARHDVIREGDRCDSVFIILEGWACGYKLLPNGDRQVTAFLMPGDCCNTSGTIRDEMDHSIGTLTHARVAAISRADMDNLCDTCPAIKQGFQHAQHIDGDILRAWIVSIGRRTAIERVAHLMCELYMRTCTIGLADGNHCEMPLTQIVLSDALGLTPVHVNRVLRKLKAGGIMELGPGTLIISDIAKLAEVAGFDENYLHRRLKQAA